ncbi:hypothetical protein [Microbispora sp. ATCC PTA-5024]|uniref:hypothetical protein n=1 Tax=Microbispora sp. ATCC PTA-5024 TaxID=316330 RepID=UPI0003DC8D97|nr:hypothetical protein [Microbispora sp. ATCC PTA-5024]ETK31249.1 hypothetical protein MPTA5024_35955 [Microbispora sp. ATCC PTA-5024]
MSASTTARRPAEPSVHQQALLVWAAVLPTLSVLQFVLGGLLRGLPSYAQPPIMATLTVPIVVYVLVPRLRRLSSRLRKG